MPDTDNLTPDQFAKDANERWAKVSACPLEGVEPPKPKGVRLAIGTCGVCGWPLYDNIEDGCVWGNCSQRPLPSKSQGESMSERPMFKDFEVVECMIGGDWRRVKLLARHEKYIWVLWDKQPHQPIELMADNMRDPNQPAEPQKCPFCGSGSDIQSFKWDTFLVRCSASSPCLMGPSKPTVLEAIQAWNSIHVGPCCINSPSIAEIEEIARHAAP